MAIRDAILAGYPDKGLLYDLLWTRWKVRARDVIHVDQAEAKAIAELVQYAKGEGRTLELLSLAWTEKVRENEALQLLADRYFPAPQHELGRYASNDDAPHFKAAVGIVEVPFPLAEDTGQEAILPRDPAPVDAVTAVNIATSAMLGNAAWMHHISAATCMVEIGEGIRASGFLIGRQAVLTVHHALNEAIAERLPGAQIRLCFDRHADSPEIHYFASSDSSWLGVFRTASSADLTGEGEAAPNELDFAVIFLEKPVEANRKPLVLPDRVPIIVPGDAMMIAQHPRAGHLEIAAGSMIGYSPDGERLQYRANTAHGSAGAPVFSATGDLIAVHHAARMIGENRIAQGVPIWPIRQAIVAAGYRLKDL